MINGDAVRVCQLGFCMKSLGGEMWHHLPWVPLCAEYSTTLLPGTPLIAASTVCELETGMLSASGKPDCGVQREAGI